MIIRLEPKEFTFCQIDLIGIIMTNTRKNICLDNEGENIKSNNRCNPSADTRRIARLDNGASIWNPVPLISAERLAELEKEHAGVLRLKQVVELSGKSKSQIYRGGRDGTFPMWVRIGANSTGWRAWEVHAWIESRPYACDETSAA